MTKSKNGDRYSRVATHNYYGPHRDQRPSWATTIFEQWGPIRNGQHQRLQTQESPCISASTTATNLSSLEFQSNSTILKKMDTLQENLRMTVPEIEPLQRKADDEDIELQAPQPRKSPSFGQIKFQVLTAIAVSWVSMIIGFSSAYTSPALLSLEVDFNFTNDELTWITSLMPLGALGGGILGGTFIENLGRKWTIVLTDVLFLVAWMVNYFARNYVYMYCSRVISGMSVGILSLTLPVYLAETVQPEVRGTLGLLPTAFGNIGILVAFMLGNVFRWQGLAMVGIVLSVPFLAAVWLIRETPRFLVSKGREAEARASLRWLRGAPRTDAGVGSAPAEAAIDREFLELKKGQKESDDSAAEGGFLSLFSRTNARLLLIVLGLMFFQQMSGINAVIFYTTRIFQEAGSTLPESVCTTIVGLVNFLATFVAAAVVDRLGRKVLLYASAGSMAVSLGVLGAYFYVKATGLADVGPVGWLPLLSFVVYVLGFSLGFGPVPWLMMGELLPARIRGMAASVATAFNWSCTFVVTKTFLLLIQAIGAHFTFWLFAGVVVMALVFTALCVPETRGQSLADIERKLAGGGGGGGGAGAASADAAVDPEDRVVRRMSSLANLKPMPSSTC